MSWEEYDLLGDLEEDRPHEYFYEDFVAEGDQVNEDEEYLNEDEIDMLEDILSVEDIDFSSLDGKNLKKDFKKINRAVEGKKVVPRKQAVKPPPPRTKKVVSERPKVVSKKPITKNRVAEKPLLKPKVAEKPLLKPKVAEKKSVIPKPTKVVSKKPKAETKPAQKLAPQKPTQKVNVPIKKSAVIQSRFGKKTTERILVPQDRKVIVEGVDKFILSNTKESEAVKNIGYYKGEKLKELVLIINNNTPNDFEFELFNPSMPLDYLFSSGQNLNNRIAVAGDNKVQYSDMLFNLLANPTLLPNAKFTVSNQVNPNQAQKQFNIPLIFKNKNIAGYEIVKPVQNLLNIDIDQNQNQIIYWDIFQTLGRAYIPDGMDIISYKVLAGNTVVFGFYYKQVSLKRFFFKEARDKKIL